MTTTMTPPHAGERGVTTIAAHAVERLAAHAVTEVDGTGGAAGAGGTGTSGATGGSGTSVASGARKPGRAATVSARVKGGVASLDVRLSVVYPASVAGTTEAARAHLIERVGEFTGLTVSRVDITVTALHSDIADAGRVR
ncbi:Asp23/Gls24 family envelope stress response protein [Streptomyces paludis]|uniref:Asp23/Gls24 family envelope stress response protein n=1 Tax=Streptomyces paludis TaxID=2282738 RepID=A0A345HIX1_9ACTN|nr:Asp23/Gls24 family envelope stress response protein [Streptomyces paludis]AXG76645.1 Asp23/Gls24 family envelope stress response protein [Streptomyces paludis]